MTTPDSRHDDHAAPADPGGAEICSDCPICTTAPPPARRAIHIALAVILGLAFTGYFFGISQPPQTPAAPYDTDERGQSGDLLPAAAYREMRSSERGPNQAWINRLSNLATPAPGPLDPVQVTAGQREQAVRSRMQRRAYDGAPPVVPHPIDQLSAANCLACHGDGLRVGDAIAPKISHAHYANCTQCHAESENRTLQRIDISASLTAEESPRPAIRGLSPPFPANTLQSQASPAAGTRAYVAAPPTIPHATHMRSDCLSCHGPNGQIGLRTAHSSRQECRQCHAPSAELDQHPHAFPITDLLNGVP